MTQEEKFILLKDLCARLPYRVKALYGKLDVEIEKVELNGDIFYRCDYEHYGYVSINLIKPYLRPMSSMTEEEKKEFDEFCVIDEDAWKGNGIIGFKNQALIMSDAIDWLNTHHFDFHGLIEKGLALDAPEGMYDIK